MKKLFARIVFYFLFVVTQPSMAIDINQNFGDVLVSQDSVSLPVHEYEDVYSHEKIFDSTFLTLSREQSVELILNRIKIHDAIKAQDWKNRLENLWNKRIELKGVVFSSDMNSGSSNEKYECTFRFRSDGRLLISSDVFNKLKGFEQAHILFQAMNAEDYFKNLENKTRHGLLFILRYSVKPYFSKYLGVGRYIDFIQFYKKQFYPNYSQLWETEFQVGLQFVSIDVSTSQFLDNDLLYPDTSQLFRFQPTRKTQFNFLNDQVLLLDRYSAFVELNKKGQLIYAESAGGHMLIKNLNLKDRYVDIFRLTDDGQAVDYIQSLPKDNLVFTTVKNQSYSVPDYLIKLIFFKNNLVSQVCRFDFTECEKF